MKRLLCWLALSAWIPARLATLAGTLYVRWYVPRDTQARYRHAIRRETGGEP